MRALVVSMLVSVLTATACSSSSPSLRVDLRTDLVPGLEFDGVVVTLEETTRMDHAVSEQDYFAGVQVARFDGLDNGLVRLNVQLTRDGEGVVDRQVRAELRGATGVTVLVTRDCRFVSCPVDGGDPVATTCVGGRCVDPGCLEEQPELCDVVCTTPMDCPGVASCAQSVCEGVACTASPLRDACPPGMVCDPERGCVDPACGSCDDSNPCTADSCVDGSCLNEARDGSECGPGRCEANRCVILTDALQNAMLPTRASAADVKGSFAALGMPDRGIVQIFTAMDGTWQPGTTLAPGIEGFGCRLSMRGDLLAVLACGATSNVSIYRLDAGDFVLESTIAYADIVPAVTESLTVGRPIAIANDVVALAVESDLPDSAVAVFTHDGAGGWSQTDFLQVTGESTFGVGLAVNERIVVGAPGNPGEPGMLFVYELAPSGYEEIHRVSAAEVTQLGASVWAPSPSNLRALGETSRGTTVFKIDERDDGFGFSELSVFAVGGVVDLENAMRVVGRPDASIGGIAAAGLAELRYFNLAATIREPFPTANRGFGGTVATDGSTVVIASFPMELGPTQVTFVGASDIEATTAPPE